MEDLNLPGRIYAVTAPSGAGKTTLNRKLIDEVSDIELSVSVTTRNKRLGEREGDHYWFVSEREFELEIAKQMMLEWAHVHGNFYGTTYAELERIIKKKKKVLLEIDVQGWAQVKQKIPNARSIFILPPSIKALWDRLSSRGTDDIHVCYLRIQNAKKELEQASSYQYFIVNDVLEKAFAQLKSIVEEKPVLELSNKKGIAYCKKLLDEFNKSSWLHDIEKSIKGS